MQAFGYEKTRPVHVAKQDTERAESNTLTKEQIHLNSTGQSTHTLRHHPWCQASRCIVDPVEGTVVHVSHDVRHALADADFDVTFWQADGDPVRVQLEVSPELVTAASVTEMIDVLRKTRTAITSQEAQL
jgi:hypothetical protein